MPSAMKGSCGVILVGLALLVVPACTDPARERFEGAEKALLDQRMETALSGYRSIPKEFPQSRHAPTALLRQGELFSAYYRNYPAALDAYESLVFNYPGSEEAPRALLRLAEIHLLHFGDPASAVEDLESIRRRYPRYASMDEVLLLLAKACGALPDAERQAAALAELIGKFPDSPKAGEGRWMLAYAYLAQGKFFEADREFRKLYYLSRDLASTTRARWGMAQALEGLGQLSAALEQYEAIRDGWEDPRYVAEKIERLKRRMKGP